MRKPHFSTAFIGHPNCVKEFYRYNSRIMSKRLFILVGIGVAIASAVIFVTCQQQNPCRNISNQDKGEKAKSAIAAKSQTFDEKNVTESNSGFDCVPCRQKLLAWPEGITVWALLLTLLVVGWQSWETSISARAMNESISLQKAGMQQWVEVQALESKDLGNQTAGDNNDLARACFINNRSLEEARIRPATEAGLTNFAEVTKAYMKHALKTF